MVKNWLQMNAPPHIREFAHWAEERRRAYEASRDDWRRDHPLIDVKKLEEEHGIAPETQSIEQLKGKGFIVRDKAEEGGA